MKRMTLILGAAAVAGDHRTSFGQGAIMRAGGTSRVMGSAPSWLTTVGTSPDVMQTETFFTCAAEWIRTATWCSSRSRGPTSETTSSRTTTS